MRRLVASLTAAALALAGAVALQVRAAAPAAALDNGLAKTPPMGWNDWNAFQCNVSEQLVEQTALAIHTDGLQGDGYSYVNIDDCWALPDRDANGNLVPDPAKFPDGIKAVADYVHSLGLKLGIYEDSGTHTCSSHGFPGSLGHEYADALQFAKWGVDYLKYDDCNIPPDGQNVAASIQRYETMRDALAAATKQTGHPIVFSICEKGDFGVPNSAWPPIGNLWRTTGDIHDSYSRMLSIVHSNVQLYQLASPGAWNDPDMLEIGNGGMTDTEYRTEFSLWSEMAAPLIAGTDLRNPSPATLAIYGNRDVIAVDQDPLGKQGVPVSSTDGHWVLSKPLMNGDRAVALFNETGTPAVISTTASAVGLPGGTDYFLKDLWTHHTTETAGTISAVVPPHATVMYRVSVDDNPTLAPPNTTFALTGLPADATPGQPVTATESFTDNGDLAALRVNLSLRAPSGWSVTPTSPTSFPAVETGQTVQATFQVTAPPAAKPFQADTVTGTAGYIWAGKTPQSLSVSETVATATPVQPPYRTFASTAASFGQVGGLLGIRADGADVYGGTNQYGGIYLPNAEQDGTVDTVEVTAQADTSDWAKAGIMVRNDITGVGSSPGFVILAVTPGHGYVLQWDANGDGHLDSSSAPPGQGTGTTTYPSWLKLVRSGTDYTGYYSTDGTTWTKLATADVPSAAPTQDAGVFATSHASGTVGEADFSGLTVGPPSGLLETARTLVTFPGQATPVAATFYDHGTVPVTGVAVTLSAPAGWTVSPSGPVSLGDVAAGGHAAAIWQVTAPSGAPSGASALLLTATYNEAGTMAASQATVTAVVPAADLSSAYDNVGITNDDNTDVGNIDGAGSSLSAQALAAAGVTPGSAVTYGGLTFAWPDVPAGVPDNVAAGGQAFTLSGSGGTLGFLATATYGPASGTGTITYTDGTTQQFTLDVPDWYSTPPAGSDLAITMAYRNRPGNTQQTHPIHVFFFGIPLQAGKTVRGLILPNVSQGVAAHVPGLHVFAVAVG